MGVFNQITKLHFTARHFLAQFCPIKASTLECFFLVCFLPKQTVSKLDELCTKQRKDKDLELIIKWKLMQVFHWRPTLRLYFFTWSVAKVGGCKNKKRREIFGLASTPQQDVKHTGLSGSRG